MSAHGDPARSQSTQLPAHRRTSANTLSMFVSCEKTLIDQATRTGGRSRRAALPTVVKMMWPLLDDGVVCGGAMARAGRYVHLPSNATVWMMPSNSDNTSGWRRDRKRNTALLSINLPR